MRLLRQFSLRWLLVATSAIAVVLAIASVPVRKWMGDRAQERRVVEAVSKDFKVWRYRLGNPTRPRTSDYSIYIADGNLSLETAKRLGEWNRLHGVLLGGDFEDDAAKEDFMRVFHGTHTIDGAKWFVRRNDN